MNILDIKNLKRYYGTKGNITKAVDGISISIQKSTFTAIVGTSGSGKSTLLHCMAGLDKPTSGEVIFGGKEIYSMNDDELSKLRRQKFGFIFQSFNLIPVLNVYDNIVLPIQLDGKKVDHSYIERLTKSVGIYDQLKKFPNELSGGQQQRVAIARALSNKPDIIFADEPTGNLDSKTTKEVMELLKNMVSEFGHTLVMITHDNDIARQADRIIDIKDGKIINDSNEL